MKYKIIESHTLGSNGFKNANVSDFCPISCCIISVIVKSINDLVKSTMSSCSDVMVMEPRPISNHSSGKALFLEVAHKNYTKEAETVQSYVNPNSLGIRSNRSLQNPLNRSLSLPFDVSKYINGASGVFTILKCFLRIPLVNISLRGDDSRFLLLWSLVVVIVIPTKRRTFRYSFSWYQNPSFELISRTDRFCTNLWLFAVK